MSDLIDRQKAIEMLEKGIREYGDEYGISDAICDLDDMPSAGPKKGKWILHKGYEGATWRIRECPFCGGKGWIMDLNYCPDCGADMRGEEDETD